MEFYNPMVKKSGATVGASLTPSASQPPGGDFTSGAGLNSQKLGNIDFQQAGTGQWGTGESFQGAGRTGALEGLTKSFSGANPEDYQGMDELRNYYRNYLNDLPGQTADHISSFDTQAQHGLNNLLAQHKTANAGTGRIGTRQYAGAEGDITSRAGSDYMNGLINARADALNSAGKIQTGLKGVQDQNMNERQFQLDQGTKLSDMIYKLMALDKGSPDKNAERAKEDRSNTMSLVGSLANAGARVAAGGGGGGGG